MPVATRPLRAVAVIAVLVLAASLTAALPTAVRPAAAATTQVGRLKFVPAPIGQTKAGRRNLTPGVARFRPARPGRAVLVQRRAGGSWDTVVRGTQDGRGRFSFNVPARRKGRLVTYRAVAVRYKALRKVVTPKRQAVHADRIFNENFKGTSLNRNRWGYRQLGLRHGSRMCAESSRRTVRVAKGKARFLVKPIPKSSPNYVANANCDYGQYYNTNLGTERARNPFTFRYGIIAARMKFAHEDGQHGGMWSQPSNGGGAEIDAVEYFGDDFRKGRIQHSIYWTSLDGAPHKAGGHFNLNYLLGRNKTWSNSFHVFSVEWTPKKYVFRVDGNETFRTKRGVSKVDQYLILSLLTSDWELPRLQRRKLNPMQVDWVRVWQR